MPNGGRFETLINRLPVDNDKLTGQAVAWFLQQQNPEKVEFTSYQNGYQIQVFADEEKVNEATEFWQENINPALGGEE